MVTVRNVRFSARTQLWCGLVVVVMAIVMEVAALNGPNVCMVKQKYNITKRVKYRAPMSVRTYEWCMSIPPRCSKWSTEMRDLTRLETEERTAEVAVCCPGYKMKDISCVPICPNGRTGHGCSQDCPDSKWGPNCVHDCPPCSEYGTCSPYTGECSCQDGWQGESQARYYLSAHHLLPSDEIVVEYSSVNSDVFVKTEQGKNVFVLKQNIDPCCESRMSSTTSTTTTTTARVEELLTKIPATKPTPPITSTIPSTARPTLVETSSTTSATTILVTPTQSSFTTKLETTATPSMVHFKVPISTPSMTTVKIIASSNKSISESTTRLESMSEISTTTAVPSTTTIITTLATVEDKISTLLVNSSLNDTSTSFVTVPQLTIAENNVEMKINKDLMLKSKIETPTTESYKTTTKYGNITVKTLYSTKILNPITKITQIPTSKPILNRTETPLESRKYDKEVHVEIKTTPIKIIKSSEALSSTTLHKNTAVSIFIETPRRTTPKMTATTEMLTKLETTRRPDATIRYFPTTVKFKPKEIWIRPAQKGESFTETKKVNHDLHIRHRVATNKEPSPNTTPKTIIVSIIPTSVSYTTFKKIALTTASQTLSDNTTLKSYNTSSIEQGFTKSMSVATTLSPLTSKSSTPAISRESTTNLSTSKSLNTTHFHKVAKTVSTLSNTESIWKSKSVPLNGTNSMTTVHQNLNSSNFITQTVSSTNSLPTTHKPSITMDEYVTRQVERVTKPVIKKVTATSRHTTVHVSAKNDTKVVKTLENREQTNATKTKGIANDKTNKITTESPDDEETFHILTEPEHITAVMEGKGKERTSVDLISVISIAGGIMMAVITVAVVIVMVERCRRPRYDDVRKMNDIHMQVMIDNNDVPPPYVRSIFHTPLPDPPTSEKCHYQPISTLDRNLKQFMRPVVVQAISPIMLENFRGILECHYDHLPRRSQDYEVRQKHCSMAPSIDDADELTHLRPCSIADSTIDALKCEARLDVLDSTTSEPLYAEIPCWRPPSEHAIEIINLNGEAVTEL